jgi:hypothetical protein
MDPNTTGKEKTPAHAHGVEMAFTMELRLPARVFTGVKLRSGIAPR